MPKIATSNILISASVAAFLAGPLALAETSGSALQGTPDAPAGSFMNRVLAEREQAKIVEADEAGDTRIYGGRPSQEGAWPAQVSLMAARGLSAKRESRVRSHFCGGTLISARWVLTAAHCVVHEGRVVPANLLAVKSGSVNLTKGKLHKADRVIVHKDYDPFENDIALVRLAEPIEGGEKIAVRLPEAGAPLPKGEAVVAGWGQTRKEQVVPALLETDIEIVDRAVCNSGMKKAAQQDLAVMLKQIGHAANIPMSKLEDAFAYLSDGMGDPVSGNMICAGTESGERDSCHGDSGGPLMVKDGNGKWVQMGIVSWGAKPLTGDIATPCGKKQLYAVYTRLPNYVDWIWKQTAATR